MSVRSLLRHSMIIFLLLMILIQNVGWENFLIWARLNQKLLLLWLVGLVVLTFLGYWLAKKQRLAHLVAALFADPKVELERHAQGLNSVASQLLLSWALCPKCLAWWLCLLFSLAYHTFHWRYWLSGLYFGFLGASLGAIISILLFLLTQQTQNPAKE